MRALLLVHTAATLFMVGVIWFVQVVHYPLFARVGEAGFSPYALEHARRTTWVVAPAMLAEAGAALGLVLRRPPGVPAWAVWTGLVLVAAIWLSTFFLQVPMHAALGGGWNAAAQEALVRTNWLRTAAWSIRGALVLWMLLRAI